MPDAAGDSVSVRCCIAGGGPAGIMLGLLLARAGVSVLVLEKHADFLRDFRGDTIHPSTLEILHELGLLEDFLKLPHQEVHQLTVQVGEVAVPIADFSHLPTRCKFIAFLPQWDFLNFLAERGARYPSFGLRMRAEVVGLLEEAGRVAGVEVATPEGRLDVRAKLVVAADGRHSVVREKANLPIETLGAPMDVLWFRISRRPDDPAVGLGRFQVGRLFVILNRGDYWQCGFIITKGTFDGIQRTGLPAFRDSVAALVPFAADRVVDIRSWDDVKLLTVLVDRLTTWYRAGLLCIGDAAHAMSPVGGVGINLAIQDAVAAANLLAEPLGRGSVTDDDLRRVQRRRAPATRVVQRFQVLFQNRVVAPILNSRARTLTVPSALRLFVRFPWLRRIPARIVGIGLRPEHVKTAPRR
jgi:2-polyprenyl-6-methoxyphenol hydroxylase-like FAD-dependent oxidoreductase